MTTDTRARLQCPKDGCTQRVEQVLDGVGGVDRDFIKCLFHGEIFIGRQPDLDKPEGRKVGMPTYRGARL